MHHEIRWSGALLAVALVAGAGASVNAAPTLDQENTVPQTGTTSIGNGNVIAQTMVVGLSGTLDAVELSLTRGAGTGDLLVEIRETPGGVLPGAVLASKVFAETEIAMAPDEFSTFDFSDQGLVLAVGQEIAVSATKVNGAGNYPVAVTGSTSPAVDEYPAGVLHCCPPGWTAFLAGNGDIRFRTFVDVPSVQSVSLGGLVLTALLALAAMTTFLLGRRTAGASR